MAAACKELVGVRQGKLFLSAYRLTDACCHSWHHTEGLLIANTSLLSWQDADTHTPTGLPRTRIVVLGSGWGAISFLRGLDPKLTSGNYLHSAAASMLACPSLCGCHTFLCFD